MGALILSTAATTSALSKNQTRPCAHPARHKPHCFDWTLHPGESFETPEAVMTFSERAASTG